MWTDPIVDETRALREGYAEELGWNLEAIFQDLKEHEGESGNPRVAFTPRPPRNDEPHAA